MWAAANDEYRRRQHRRCLDKERRNIPRDGSNLANNKTIEKDGVMYDADAGTEPGSESDDGAISTTESVSCADPSGPKLKSKAALGAVLSSEGGKTQKRKQYSPKEDPPVFTKKKKQKQRHFREETPEATIARLVSSYSAAMEAVGALHRASQQCSSFLNDPNNLLFAKNVVEKLVDKEAKMIDDLEGAENKHDCANRSNDAMHEINDESKHMASSKKDNKPTSGENSNLATDSGGKSSNISRLENANDTTLGIQKVQLDATKSIEKEKLKKAFAAIQRVGQAARAALEASLLLDPLILAPIFLSESSNANTGQTKRVSSLKKANIMSKMSTKQFEKDNSNANMSSAWLNAWNENHVSTNVTTENSTAIDKSTVATMALRKWKRLSEAHRSTVNQIAYLALVNYADLLLCGCSCNHIKSKAIDGLLGDTLDKGAVAKLKALGLLSSFENPPVSDNSGNDESVETKNKDDKSNESLQQSDLKSHHSNCIWQNETRERTIRLALASYCDASELDSSDPSLWFKLACAARALGRVINRCTPRSLSMAGPPKSYCCLERLALERGMSSLPPGVPPNRMLMKAWKDIVSCDQLDANSERKIPESSDQNDSKIQTDCQLSRQADNHMIELVIYLPRNSWSTLGRILIRACKEGAAYGKCPPVVSHIWSTNCKSPEDFLFGSPLIEIHTARALDIDVTNDPAEKDSHNQMKHVRNETNKAENDNKYDETDANIENQNAMELEKNQTQATEVSASKSLAGDNGGVGRDALSADKIADHPEGDSNPIRRGRVSKRLQSQLKTSEKQTERKAKRTSVEYCLLSGVLSCTAENPYYTQQLKESYDWGHLRCLEKCEQKLLLIKKEHSELTKDATHTNQKPLSSAQGDNYDAFDMSSLKSFVDMWSRRNSGPRHFLEKFLVYVSVNFGDVFAVENTETLSTCIIDCFGIATSKNEIFTEVATVWYGPEIFGDIQSNPVRALEILSVNTLIAELLLKRCEAHDAESIEIQDDTSILAFMVPRLCELSSMLTPQLQSSPVRRKCALEIEIRCHWLASSYFFWLGQWSDSSVLCEESGMAQLDLAVNLSNPALNKGVHLSIKVPQLDSPNRSGNHWNILSFNTLSNYQQSRQSTSVLSTARQAFQGVQRCLEDSTEEVTDDIKLKLSQIGSELLSRYSSRNKQDELLSDFISLYQDRLLSEVCRIGQQQEHKSKMIGDSYWGPTWSLVPSSQLESVESISKDTSRISILRVLAASLLASEEQISSVFSIYAEIAEAALQSRYQHRVCDGPTGEIGETQCQQEDPPLGNDMSREEISKTAGRDFLFMIVANFFVDKLTNFIDSYKNVAGMNHAINNLASGEVLPNIIFMSLNVSLDLDEDSPNQTPALVHLIYSISRLVVAIRNQHGLSKESREKLECVYFASLVKALIRQRKKFCQLHQRASDKRMKKWNVHLKAKADFIAVVGSDLADLMSSNPSTIDSKGTLVLSHLIQAIVPNEAVSCCSVTPLTQLTESLLWFWKYLSAEQFTSENVWTRLIIPISSAIISLCGSHGISVDSFLDNTSKKQSASCLNFSDYFDSEDSVNGSFLSNGEPDNEHRRKTMRMLCQLTQCISLVFSTVPEKIACQESPYLPYPSSFRGPFLPLVTVRTLSSISDEIFVLFSEDRGVWCEQYPYGARSCGSMIDNLLAKAYRCIYGFTLLGQSQSFDLSKMKAFIPESTKAAAQLFRCIKRMYNNNRRSPPTKALEVIASALPAGETTAVSKAIREFLFDPSKRIDSKFSTSDFPDGFPRWVLTQEHSNDSSFDEIGIVRKGICHYLAKGPIDYNQTSPCGSDDQGLSQERELTKNHELSLNKKFCSVLDDLCYNPDNVDGWILLSECLGFKADIICDRLVPILQPYSSCDFLLSLESMRKSPTTMALEQLKEFQLQEFEETREKWVPYIGDNLYAYMKYPWSTFSTLQACAKDIGRKISESHSADHEMSDYSCWKEIESKFENGDYAGWANAWAGMFVMALRSMRTKALKVARFLAKTKRGARHPSEVCEDLGTAHYGDLMLSSVYGFPMHKMTSHEKRKVAECSRYHFQEAINLSKSKDFVSESQTVSWELQFMIGKCYEKIAFTFSEEVYAVTTDGHRCARLYEVNMKDAIKNYAHALTDAQEVERIGGGIDRTAIGGSSHGALEVLYRLHASRFKLLLSAIKRAKEERNCAEIEAHRIASLSWFDDSNRSSPSNDIRGKTWDIFADTVAALTQCRIDIPLFHRAAYRIAQAFNWAPVFHDPECDMLAGSNQAVPATKSYRIRGLNTGSCAESAGVVIGSLFQKKRSQLCSVWVTTSTTPPPFEVLNDSVRKYDAIRLKYIEAYIDCMRGLRKKDKIENLLNLALSSGQDLAGFYEASAAFQGGDPGNHKKQSLLHGSGFISKVKRRASSALAEMVLSDLAEMKKSGVGDKERELLNKDFKLTYLLFQRINISCEDIVRFICATLPVIEVNAFVKCYISVQAGYRINDAIHLDTMDASALCSLLEEAVSKAKKMFHLELRTPSKAIKSPITH